MAEWELHNLKWQEGFRLDWESEVDAMRQWLDANEGSRFRDWKKYQRDNGVYSWKPLDGSEKARTYAEWDGERPERDMYMPTWTVDEAIGYQMYETCSEGTPISPVKSSPEKLARWLADNEASAFGDRTATYEQWLEVCRVGDAVSAVISPTHGLISGVEALANSKPEE